MSAERGSGELAEMLGALRTIADEARATFGAFSARQVNWKPSPEQWSVGQCFEHLIKTNRSFFPTLEQLARGERRSTVWEHLSPLSGFFGKVVVKSLAPDSGRKFKAPRGVEPATSDIEAGVISHFAEHQNELTELMKRAGTAADLKRTIVTSPLSRFVTYSLRDAFRIVVVHERRHFEQARRVTQEAGFPASERVAD